MHSVPVDWPAHASYKHVHHTGSAMLCTSCQLACFAVKLEWFAGLALQGVHVYMYYAKFGAGADQCWLVLTAP